MGLSTWQSVANVKVTPLEKAVLLALADGGCAEIAEVGGVVTTPLPSQKVESISLVTCWPRADVEAGLASLAKKGYLRPPTPAELERMPDSLHVGALVITPTP